MDCDGMRDLLSDYLGERLPECDRAVVADHLDGCPQCAAEAAGLSETIALLSSLPREKAPPELFERIMEGIGKEAAGTPGQERRFRLPRVSIPLEAAAAVLLFALVYGIQRGMPVRSVLTDGESGRPRAAATPSRESSPRLSDAAPPIPAAPREFVPPAEPARVRAPDAATPPAGGKGESPRGAADIGREAAAAKSAPELPPATALRATPVLPAAAATRVSSAAEAIEPKIFAAPPSRQLKTVPYGREVTLYVAPGEREGIEGKIAAAAERLGGALHPMAASPAGGAEPFPPGAVRVHLPRDSAGAFLDALKGLGTIPQEGMPAAADFPAGPSPEIVAYTVRIRVR